MSIERTNHNELTNRAYQLWEKAGRPEGRDLEFWLQAEQQIRSHGNQSADARPASTATTAVNGARQSLSASGPTPRRKGHNPSVREFKI